MVGCVLSLLLPIEVNVSSFGVETPFIVIVEWLCGAISWVISDWTCITFGCNAI